MARAAVSKLGDRDGRGRLSSIDLLPEEAEPDIVWANENLRDRTMHSNAILAEFNKRLADRGIGPISKSSWGRYSVRKAIQFRKLDEVQRISGELVSAMGTDGPDQVTIAVAEMVKLAAFQALEGGEQSTKGIMELARALSAVVGAQKTSTDHRRRLEEDMRSRVDKAIKQAGEKMAGEGALGTDAAQVLKRIREDVYGIFSE